MPKRQARASARGPMLALLLAATATGCNPEADLAAYFGTPSPSAQPSPSVTHSPEPTIPGQPSASPTPTSDASPTDQPSPTIQPSPTDQPTATPAWSPMPTRPPGLAEFVDLRNSADVTDISRLSANPEGLIGSSVYFEGRVNQVDENNGRVRARVKIGDNFVFLVYRTDRYWGDHPLIQGDRIRVVGEFLGLAAGGERLPEIEPIDMMHRFT